MNYYLSVDAPEPRAIQNSANIHRLHDTAFIINGTSMVTFGKLSMLISDTTEKFSFGLWIRIQMKEIEELVKKESVYECRGILIGDLPFYNSGKDDVVKVYFDPNRPDFKRPSLYATSSMDEVYLHQKYGLPRELYLKWMRMLESGGAVFSDTILG